MECGYFQAGLCRSCTWIERPYAQQIADKQAACQAALPTIASVLWDAPVLSAEIGFRNKAKMVVGGSVEQPVLGITDARGQAVDLSACALYPSGLRAAFAPLREFISQAGLEPYNVVERRGELKFVLLTHAEHSGELVLRFVLRSRQPLAALQAHLPALYAALPGLAVASVNLQPVHQAILEGEEEIILSARTTLAMSLNGMTLYLRPRSFFQTNTQVAAALYRTAREWVAELAPVSAWDLFCGVGGFALHLAPVVRGQVVGIEVSTEAIASAQQSALELGVSNAQFRALSADAFALGQRAAPELAVVNPPRRGLGTDLCVRLQASTARWVLYSSCNPQTLAQDLARMPDFVPLRAQLFDMFPHTAHGEVLVLLARRL
ncbi:MAG: 23S rRNA (uracil(747)-C(5))-methyltransferase RlmC [Gammaproteobacteria bacterium 28-57-27]|nr:MAG: 23S rRNA (uracil(747)-C(5))-methyltransferase RlmC [Gammaproteobacteria bacterium 28-57-27]